MDEMMEAPLIVIVFSEPAFRATRAETDEAPEETEMETGNPVALVATDMFVAGDG
jgi:hypothetical protein